MIVQVELREILDAFDYRTWKVAIPCADGSQKIRWLAYASCLRMSIIHGDVHTRYVPQAIKNQDGALLDADKVIKDCLLDGSEVIIECTGGPKAFTTQEDSNVDNSNSDDPNQFSLLTVEFYPGIIRTDTDTTNILQLIDWSKCNVDDVTLAKTTLSPYVGLLQALVIWYSCQGKEVEDKDFGVLNINQFLQVFRDGMGIESSNKIAEVFEGLVKTKGDCAYQMTILDFFPAIFSVAALDLKTVNEEPSIANSSIFSQVDNLIQLHLAPLLSNQITQFFKDLQEIPWKDCLKVLEAYRESVESCIKVSKPNDIPDDPLVVPFQRLLPFLRKWLVLDKYWSPQVMAALVISALQSCTREVKDFVEVPLNLHFGIHELEQFLCGAANFCQKSSFSPIKISNKSYLQDYLKSFFARAGLTRLPYTTYDEKKDYLRSLLIKKENQTTSMFEALKSTDIMQNIKSGV